MEKKEKKQGKGNIRQILVMLVFFAICFGIGYFGGSLLDDFGMLDTLVESVEKTAERWGIRSVAVMVLMLVGSGMIGAILAFYGQIILHEAGHLVTGLISGYRFVSFRIGSLILYRREGRFHLTTFSIPGTAGQCLMRPPVDKKPEEMPVFLYNLGGVLVNVISVIVAVCLLCMGNLGPLMLVFHSFTVLLGAILAITNGIPMKVGGVPNDGLNAKSLGKDPEAMYGFWMQLEMNARQTEGERLKNMPQEWFYLPETEKLANPMYASIGVLYYQYLRDAGEYEKSYEIASKLMDTEAKLIGLYQNEIRCEQLFDELLGSCEKEYVDRLNDKKLQAYRKATRGYLSRIRLEYAYALLYERNEAKAEKYRIMFEKRALRTPTIGEVPGEREAMEMARQKAVQQEK